MRLLKEEGHEVTQSSVSRDLRDLGVLKASGRYVLPPEEVTRANGDFGMLAQFVRGLKRAGPSLTVLKTTVGAAQSVAVAIDKAAWLAGCWEVSALGSCCSLAARRERLPSPSVGT